MHKFLFAMFSVFFTYAVPTFALDKSDIPFIESEWNKAPNFSETKVLKLWNRPDLKKSIPLTLVIYKDSGWTLDEVLAKLYRTAEIFGQQCYINFNPILILETRSKFGPTLDWDNSYAHLAPYKLEQSGALVKPIIYFAKNELKDRGLGGASWPKGSEGGIKSKEALNTAILYRYFAFKENKSAGYEVPFKYGYYEVLAHELAHILMDMTHTPAPGDIMTESVSKRTNRILPLQCGRIYKNFLPGAKPPKIVHSDSRQDVYNPTVDELNKQIDELQLIIMEKAQILLSAFNYTQNIHIVATLSRGDEELQEYALFLFGKITLPKSKALKAYYAYSLVAISLKSEFGCDRADKLRPGFCVTLDEVEKLKNEMDRLQLNHKE